MNKLLLVIPIILLIPITLAAPDVPKAEIYGGYSLIHDDGMNMNGFSAAVEGSINKYFGIVGEFDFGRKSRSYSYLFPLDETLHSTDETLTGLLFMGGPRFSCRAEKLRVFDHFLAGGYRYSSSASTSSAYGYSKEDSDSMTHFGVAVGGGVDIALLTRSQFGRFN